jgi:cbb3-type cytochrome oxidase subunit 3
MKQLALSAFPMKFLPILGFVLFILFFFGVLFWVYKKQNPKVYEYLSQLPLKEESNS